MRKVQFGERHPARFGLVVMAVGAILIEEGALRGGVCESSREGRGSSLRVRDCGRKGPQATKNEDGFHAVLRRRAQQHPGADYSKRREQCQGCERAKRRGVNEIATVARQDHTAFSTFVWKSLWEMRTERATRLFCNGSVTLCTR